MTRSRVALFGGTFDPVHQGHLEVATKAHEALDLDEIIFLPCRRSPHKENSPGASDRDRFRMLQLATEDLTWASVSDYELQKPPPSFTYETVTHFAKEFGPGTQLFLLIGLDQWNSLPRWKEPEIIAAHAHFIVVGRDGEGIPRDGYQATFLPGNHPASASKIRRQLAANEEPSWLPPKVIVHISENQLYFPSH